MPPCPRSRRSRRFLQAAKHRRAFDKVRFTKKGRSRVFSPEEDISEAQSFFHGDTPYTVCRSASASSFFMPFRSFSFQGRLFLIIFRIYFRNTSCQEGAAQRHGQAMPCTPVFCPSPPLIFARNARRLRCCFCSAAQQRQMKQTRAARCRQRPRHAATPRFAIISFGTPSDTHARAAPFSAFTLLLLFAFAHQIFAP